MEDLRSHTKRCDVTREQLDEWYNHRIRVEAELSKLAWHFEKWGQESESHIAAGSVAGKSKNTGPKQENTVKWMDVVVGLLENDRILSDKLFNSIAELQTNEAVLSFKNRCGIFDGEGHSSPTECCTSNSAREACHRRENKEFLLRQKVKTPLLCKAIYTLAIFLPWHLAEVVKHIKLLKMIRSAGEDLEQSKTEFRNLTELHRRAVKFDKWGKDSESAAGVVPGKGEAGTLDGRVSGEAASGKSKNVEAAKEEKMKKWMDFVVGILENDAILSDKLLNSITEIHTNEAVLLYGRLDNLLRHKTPLLLGAINTLAMALPWSLIEVVKRIKDVACKNRRFRCETAKLFHVFAATAKVQREAVRSLIMEYLEE